MKIRQFVTTFLIVLLGSISGFGQSTTKYTTVNLNLRTNPNTNCRVITVIPKGTAVTINENCDCDWILVSYQNCIGYVSSKYLTKKKVERANPTSVVRYYTNTYGQRVQSPTHYNAIPMGATAICRDGTYSFSRNRRGTCSHHGGVARWL
jgi:uncharacterized protein YgiM (DUF1202 family)